MIRSTFKIEFIFWFLLMLLVSCGIFWMLATTIHDFIYVARHPSTILLGLFFLFLVFVAIVVLSEFKYIVINKKENQLTWYSIIALFGKKSHLNNFIGVMKNTEYSASGATTSIYFIDKNWTTAGKINGQYYSNFDEILTAINLKEVKNKNHGFKNYLKLLYFGHVKIKK